MKTKLTQKEVYERDEVIHLLTTGLYRVIKDGMKDEDAYYHIEGALITAFDKGVDVGSSHERADRKFYDNYGK